MDVQLKALAAARRREILELVRDRELAAGQIATHFEITRPAVSQHLTVLKEAGLLAERRDGVRRLYRANAAGLADLKRFIDGFWAAGLDRLRSAAEVEHGRGATSGADGRQR